ncbi:lipopolysaccharide heptosyltransferase II [Acidobacteriota bacterium]
MKIVIRAPNWIGDSILALPAMYSLSKNYPEAQIWIAARSWVKNIFNWFDFIEGTIALPDQMHLKNLRKSAQDLKQFNFDTGVLFTNSFSSSLLFYMAKIPQRWGYATDSRRLLLTKGITVKKNRPASHQVHYYLSLLSSLGLKTYPPELSLPLNQEEKRNTKNLLKTLNVNLKNRLVLINPGAFYGSAKRWPATHYAMLANFLQERKKANILLIGSKDERMLAESIAANMKEKPIIMTGKTSLTQLIGLIHYADLLITNDSGPMHIANALRIPVIALFGPTDPVLTGPFQEPFIVIKKESSCWPCPYRECPLDHRCMKNITPEEVYRASQKYLP